MTVKAPFNFSELILQKGFQNIPRYGWKYNKKIYDLVTRRDLNEFFNFKICSFSFSFSGEHPNCPDKILSIFSVPSVHSIKL